MCGTHAGAHACRSLPVEVVVVVVVVLNPPTYSHTRLCVSPLRRPPSHVCRTRAGFLPVAVASTNRYIMCTWIHVCVCSLVAPGIWKRQHVHASTASVACSARMISEYCAVYDRAGTIAMRRRDDSIRPATSAMHTWDPVRWHHGRDGRRRGPSNELISEIGHTTALLCAPDRIQPRDYTTEQCTTFDSHILVCDPVPCVRPIRFEDRPSASSSPTQNSLPEPAISPHRARGCAN